MKVLIAISIAFSSISASATSLCLGRTQAENVPHRLNIRLHATLDKSNGLLVLQNQADPSMKWTYLATEKILDRRQSFRQCQRLSEDYMRERFRVALEQRSPNDRIATLLMLQIGMFYGANFASGNLCSGLDTTRLFRLSESNEAAPGDALLGKHLLVELNATELTIMEGALGFIYHEQACLPARLK